MRHTARFAFYWLTAAACCVSVRGGDQPTQTPAVVPQRQAHAHNDYLHARPLHDALDQGFCSVEADIFLTAKGLLIGHELNDLTPQRTLQTLYLDPLRERVRARNGWVQAPDVPFFLLIDVKTEAKETYLALDRVLALYADILSVTRDGRFERKPVTVVLSGNRAQDLIKQQTVRYVGIDGRPEDLDATAPVDLMPWISARWGSQFRWQGEGPFPPEERQKLRDYVRKAHEQGRQVRFWATLDKEFMWRELAAAEVDFINTDDLAGLRKFLMTQP